MKRFDWAELEKAISRSIGPDLFEMDIAGKPVRGHWRRVNGANTFISTSGEFYQRAGGYKSPFSKVPSVGSPDKPVPSTSTAVKPAARAVVPVSKPVADRKPVAKTTTKVKPAVAKPPAGPLTHEQARAETERIIAELTEKMAATKSPIWKDTYKKRLRLHKRALAGSVNPPEVIKPIDKSELAPDKLSVARMCELRQVHDRVWKATMRAGAIDRFDGTWHMGNNPLTPVYTPSSDVAGENMRLYDEAMDEKLRKEYAAKGIDEGKTYLYTGDKEMLGKKLSGRPAIVGRVGYDTQHEDAKAQISISIQPPNRYEDDWNVSDRTRDMQFVSAMFDPDQMVIATECDIKDLKPMKVKVKKAFGVTRFDWAEVEKATPTTKCPKCGVAMEWGNGKCNQCGCTRKPEWDSESEKRRYIREQRAKGDADDFPAKKSIVLVRHKRDIGVTRFDFDKAFNPEQPRDEVGRWKEIPKDVKDALKRHFWGKDFASDIPSARKHKLAAHGLVIHGNLGARLTDIGKKHRDALYG